MDLMAKYLAQKNDPNEAWSTIFQQPSNKEWSEVKVAFKVNAVYTRIMPHIAIIDNNVYNETVQEGDKFRIKPCCYTTVLPCSMLGMETCS